MKSVLITGASGLLGRALDRHLKGAGWEVRTLGRSPGSEGHWQWDPEKRILPVEALIGCDAVVHLAGESLIGRWTAAKKDRIVRSRVEGTRLLAEKLASVDNGPRIWITASGAHCYPADGELHDENSGKGSGFLAGVCEKWEAATSEAEAAGIGLIRLRTGMVVAGEGGALAQMRLPFKMGLGGPVGSGRQWMSWIELKDWCRLVEWAIETEAISGPLNAVSPEPVQQREFARALARILRRPAVMPLPAFMVRLMMGQMGEEMLLASLRVLPSKAIDAGFQFSAASIETALKKHV